MSTLTERREERKAEAQALADKYQSLVEEGKKYEKLIAQTHADFVVKNAQYTELDSLVKEEESSACSVDNAQQG